jgi:hypothetical protein
VFTATTKTHKLLAAALAAFVFLGAATASYDKRLSIYSSVASYTLPVPDRMGREYVGLLEVLEPLGRISARVEGQHWKLRFNDNDCDFIARKSRARVRGRDVDLGGPFLIENSRGLVPLSSLSTLLPRFLGNPVNFHEPARRLFIGEAGTQVTAQLDQSNPPRLVLNFSAPVNPMISTEPGKLRMVFTREPLVTPATASLDFNNPTITQAVFSESNGLADFTVAAAFLPLPPSATMTHDHSGAFRGALITSAKQFVSGQSNANGHAEAETLFQYTMLTLAHCTRHRGSWHGGTERGAVTDTLAENGSDARPLRHELKRQGLAVPCCGR